MTVSRSVALVAAVLLPAAAMAETIEGVVDFSGKPPRAGKLHREADPFCAKTPMTDPTVLVKDGKLQNVWVHVTEGPGADQATPPAKPVEVDQKNCMYEPRVSFAVVGQKVVTKNDDDTLHNVHAYVRGSTIFNKGMPNQHSPAIEYVPKQAEMITLRCDVHPWMRGYIGVAKNDMQAVSGEDGTFKIENVQPGTYTLTAWHEKYGEKTAQVTVEKGKTAKVTFTYSGEGK